MSELTEMITGKIAAASVATSIALGAWGGSQLFENAKVDSRQTQSIEDVEDSVVELSDALEALQNSINKVSVDVGVIKARTERIEKDVSAIEDIARGNGGNGD